MRLYGEFKDGKAVGGYISTVRIFFWIGMVVLLISCINFMNLSIARSRKRTLEIGLRKTFGARRTGLIRQFICESVIVVSISMILSVVSVLLLLPLFGTFVSLQLAIDITNPYHTVGFLIVGLFCILFSGAYPAFFLSAFSPVNTLKKLKTVFPGSVEWMRKGLIVFQFAASFILVNFIMVIYLQINHLHNRSLGMDLERLVYFNVTNEIRRNFPAVQEQIISSGYASHAGLSNQTVIDIGNIGKGYNWKGKDSNIELMPYKVNISPGLLETLGIHFLEGSDYTYHYFDENNSTGIIINRSFADIMGNEGRIGGHIIEGNGNTTTPVTGIVENFVFGDMSKETVEPTMFYQDYINSNYLFVRLKTDITERASIAGVQKILQTFNPERSFEPVYMDDVFDRKLTGIRFVGKLTNLFGILAVVLSCMGLFGLSAFEAEQRTKEIGIRKVLGASTGSIIGLLGNSFMRLLMVAFVLAAPVAWYIGQRWLQNYGYRISLEWYVFAVTGLLVALIAMLAVSVQSFKAATINPVKVLKIE